MAANTDPAEAWANLKADANRLAERVCALFREEVARVKTACGQDVPFVDVLGSDVRITIHRDHVYVIYQFPTGHNGPFLYLPWPREEHWGVRASLVRLAVQRLAEITQSQIADAIARVLDDQLERFTWAWERLKNVG